MNDNQNEPHNELDSEVMQLAAKLRDAKVDAFIILVDYGEATRGTVGGEVGCLTQAVAELCLSDKDGDVMNIFKKGVVTAGLMQLLEGRK